MGNLLLFLVTGTSAHLTCDCITCQKCWQYRCTDLCGVGRWWVVGSILGNWNPDDLTPFPHHPFWPLISSQTGHVLPPLRGIWATLRLWLTRKFTWSGCSCSPPSWTAGHCWVAPRVWLAVSLLCLCSESSLLVLNQLCVMFICLIKQLCRFLFYGPARSTVYKKPERSVVDILPCSVFCFPMTTLISKWASYVDTKLYWY